MTTVSICAMTDQGVVRGTNEDSVMVARCATGDLVAPESATVVELSEGPLVLAVADGMGGANAGEVASALTLDALREHLKGDLHEVTEADALRGAIRHAHETVHDASLARADQTGMGATLVVALLKRTRSIVAVVGDSRAYLLRLGSLVPLTRDQTFVQVLIDSGVVPPEEAATHPNRSIVLQAIGSGETADAAMLEFGLRRGDRLLLCSDGLTNEVSETEVETLLGANDDPLRACRALVDAAKARGGRDNISAVVAIVDGDDLAPPSRDDALPSPPPSGHFVSSPK